MKWLLKIKRRGISKRLFAYFDQNVVMWPKLDKYSSWTIGHKRRIEKSPKIVNKISKDFGKVVVQSMWRQWHVTNKKHFRRLLNSFILVYTELMKRASS